MPTAEKAQVIEQTREKFERSAAVYFTEYRGLSVQQLQALRAQLREKGGEIQVIKNTLFRRAAGDAVSDVSEEMTSGPTAIAFAYENETECAKVLLDFTKGHKVFKVKGGLVDGKAFDAQGVEEFSKLPPRDQLIAMVIGAIAAPLSNLVGVVEALYADPIRVIGAVADKVAEGGAPDPATASSETAEAPAEATTTEETASENQE